MLILAAPFLTLLTPILAGSPSQDPPQESPLVRDDSAPALRGAKALLSPRSRAERVARDRRLSFTSSSAERARALLARGPDGALPDDRAAAVMTIGCYRSRRDLETIDQSTQAARFSERRAAIFALGEFGEWGLDALRRISATDVPGLEETVVLAILRAGEQGSSEARGLVELLAADRTSPLNEAATTLLPMARGGRAPVVLPALDHYYELRWRAARQFGYVDGRKWKQVLIEDLSRDELFLDRFVLTAATALEERTVRDHMVEILLEGGRPGALRASTYVMPDVLTRLFNAGEWRPRSVEEWRIVIEELDDRRSERDSVDLLRAAFHYDTSLQPLAGLLLYRSGAELPWVWVEEQLESGPESLKLDLIEATGDRADPERIPALLAILRRRPDLVTAATANVALTRLGQENAGDGIIEVLEQGPGPERDALFLALSQVAHDRQMLLFIDKALRLPDIPDEARLRLQLSYALTGRLHDREILRDWLEQTPNPHPLRRLAVRGLKETADDKDLAVLEHMFPTEADMDLNVELALALLKYREPVALYLIREALWADSWNRSVLAGGLLIRATSVFDLIDDLDSPPSGVTAQDRRRVGFAIGQWGGLPAVEALAARKSERDPALQGAFLGALSTRTH